VDLINPNQKKQNKFDYHIRENVVRTKSQMRWPYTLEETYYECQSEEKHYSEGILGISTPNNNT
jgi:hypothetical protein